MARAKTEPETDADSVRPLVNRLVAAWASGCRSTITPELARDLARALERTAARADAVDRALADWHRDRRRRAVVQWASGLCAGIAVGLALAGPPAP